MSHGFALIPSPMELHYLENAIRAREAARFLSIAATVTLFYDHLLLLDQEVRLIWRAEGSRWKLAFLLNRYIVPACLVIAAYQESLISVTGYSDTVCKVVFSILPLMGTVSLAISNSFVFFRIYAIWGYNPTILRILVATYVCTYLATLCLAITALSTETIPRIFYSEILKECTITGKLPLLAATWAVPLLLDVVLVALTVLNSLFRPLSIESSSLSMELLQDGAVYFVISLSLRIFNVVVYTSLDVIYATLPAVLIWAGITTVMNRMILLGSSVAYEIQLQGYDPEVRSRGQTDTPFKLPFDYDGDDSDADLTPMDHHFRRAMDEENSTVLDLRRESTSSSLLEDDMIKKYTMHPDGAFSPM
ncbi:hypothetical protein M422DRAFT_780568 [Sphaerobolus stellatus SS14]|uniref:DUF6533 domain-containing protein n=1 Tax=Sphaerobolus stellatus (strain SS14) TaxID=990650 RepID=A0A0C9VHQ1_SPHS4|nr:hypothetical protein M422DRAFT_780568 [Sphaerobolus stellatus SS14]